jgi:putative ABC transport system ATP-binding protein
MIPLVCTRDLTKRFLSGEAAFAAIDRVTFTLLPGEFTAIMGPSGSGKSTFMNIIGCLDRPTSGSYELEGVDVSRLNSNQLADIRRTRLGFVFQSYNLLPRTSALENVELPLIYAPISERERRERARRGLADVGLDSRSYDQFTSELSGGQAQRVAIARALVNEPRLILADEPTGALDSKTSRDIMELFVRLNRERGLSILMVTHEADVARYSRRIVSFLDGRIVGDAPVAAQAKVAVAT